MLIRRIVTTLIGLPILLGILVYGSNESVMWFFGVCTALAVHEAAAMILPEFDALFAQHAQSPGGETAVASAGDSRHLVSDYRYSAIRCALLAFGLYVAVANVNSHVGLGIVVTALWLLILSSIFFTRGIDAEVSRMAGVLVTIVYAGLPWLLVLDLFELRSDRSLIYLLLAVVWGGDTGAYFGGRFFGKTKLSPHKSPKKTWEGAVAGFVASIIAAIVIEYLLRPFSGSYVRAAVAGALCGSLGQMGDLVESVIKRFARVKDSGAIFPGHGGFLDRVDGLLVAAPGLWLFVLLMESASHLARVR